MDPRIKRTKDLLKTTLKYELETHTFDEITVTQICNSSTINKTTFYRHYNDLYDLYKDFLEDLFEEGINEIYGDCSIFLMDPYKCFLLNDEIKNTGNYIYFKKQLRENPVDLFDNLYLEILKDKIYNYQLLVKNPENDIKIEIALKTMKCLLKDNSMIELTDRANIYKEIIETLFEDFYNK